MNRSIRLTTCLAVLLVFSSIHAFARDYEIFGTVSGHEWGYLNTVGVDLNNAGAATGYFRGSGDNYQAWYHESGLLYFISSDYVHPTAGPMKWSRSLGVNDNGTVYGIGLNLFPGVRGTTEQAFKWTVADGITQLTGGNCGAKGKTYVIAMNNNDQAVGYQHMYSTCYLMWDSDGTPHELGGMSVADINDDGWVVGTDRVRVTDETGTRYHQRAYLLKGIGQEKIYILPPGEVFTHAKRINNAGQVLLGTNGAVGQNLYVWDEYNGFKLVSTDPRPYWALHVRGFNDNGHVLFDAHDDLSEQEYFSSQPFVWFGEGDYYFLGQPENGYSLAKGINNFNEVVGNDVVRSKNAKKLSSSAYLWDEGTGFDTINFVNGKITKHFNDAVLDINDYSEVMLVRNMKPKDGNRLFLLRPLD